MARRNLNDLLYFVTVAREGSFTRAASLMGVTQSALSQAVSGLEARLEIRLLTPLLLEYPEIDIEFDINYGFRDIVADRFDAGVRLGDTIDKDMIATPIGPQLRMAVAASPAYFATHPAPRQPSDLVNHNCINMRLQSAGGLYAWEFEHRGHPLDVRVDGQLIFNTSPAMVDAALAGVGIAFLPEDEFAPHLEEGRLLRVLEAYCPPFPGYYLYYPSRRQPSHAFSLVLDALRVTR